MGSVPFILMFFKVTNLNINMINFGSSSQLCQEDSWNKVIIHTIQAKGKPNYSLHYLSNSWAFTGDTRQFDLIDQFETGFTNFFIVKRNSKQEIKEADEKPNSSLTRVLIISLITVSAIAVTGLIAYIIIKCIVKNKINEYVSSVTEQPIEIT